MADAPAASYSFAISIYGKSGAISPLDGEAFFTSQINEIPFFFKRGEDARHFENSRSGYFDIIGIDENALEERKVAERKERMLQNAVKDIRMPFIIIASFLAILLLIILFS